MGHGVNLVRRGKDWWGRCPFHGERTPSFHINEASGLWYCFGCKQGGASEELFRRFEGDDWHEAVGIEPPPASKRRQVVSALEALWKLSVACWPERDKWVDRYLEERGLNGDGFGWSPDIRWVKDAASALGVTEDQLRLAGLGETRFSMGRRLLVRLERKGRLIGLAGRGDGTLGPKWVFPRGSEASVRLISKHKRRMSSGSVYLVEGAMDLEALFRAGLEAYASLGARVTPEQASDLALEWGLGSGEGWIGIDFDSDFAGLVGAAQAVCQCLKRSLPVRIRAGYGCAQSDGLDPDERIAKIGRENYEKQFALGPHGNEWLRMEYASAVRQQNLRWARTIRELVSRLEEDVIEAWNLGGLADRSFTPKRPSNGNLMEAGVRDRLLLKAAACGLAEWEEIAMKAELEAIRKVAEEAERRKVKDLEGLRVVFRDLGMERFGEFLIESFKDLEAGEELKESMK
jgi:hypothetical protein